MAINIVNLTIPPNTPNTNPVTVEVSLSQPYIRHITAQTAAANVGFISFQITSENMILAPSLGIGLSAWIALQSQSLDWLQFYRLSGPPYRIQVSAYNTNTVSGTLSLAIETDHFEWLPVNVMNVSTHTQPQQLRGDPSKSEQLEP